MVFGFCFFQNNQGLGKGYQLQPSASANNPYSHLDSLDIKNLGTFLILCLQNKNVKIPSSRYFREPELQ